MSSIKCQCRSILCLRNEEKHKSKVRFVEEEFEDTKETIRIRISKRTRQHNDQKKKYKRTNNDLPKHTYKTKDRVTPTYYRFVTRLTRRVRLVEQELLTLPEHLSSPRFLVGFVLLDL
jgi:hypothetical protein